MTDHGMNWVDWIFVGIPILLVVLAALKSQKYSTPGRAPNPTSAFVYGTSSE